MSAVWQERGDLDDHPAPAVLLTPLEKPCGKCDIEAKDIDFYDISKLDSLTLIVYSY